MFVHGQGVYRGFPSLVASAEINPETKLQNIAQPCQPYISLIRLVAHLKALSCNFLSIPWSKGPQSYQYKDYSRQTLKPTS